LNLFTRVSELLQGELNVWRGHVLEFVVIFLIAFEIVSAILRSKI
jgi:mRNA-degrading endonuclease RelE of RelBE toxin-antitoxin system